MTDEQQKRLAAIVLIDSERLDVLSQIVTDLIERMADDGDDFDGRANKLRSGAEQLAAGAVDAAKEREELRKYFGLA
jgi:predicted secreted protein